MSERQLIQSRHGDLYAYPDDTYLGEAICKYGEYSEMEFQFLADVLQDCQEPRTVVEVGANAGYLSVPLMKLAYVVAFEPQTSSFGLLMANMCMNASPRYGYSARHQAVGERTETIRCPRHYYETPGNHGGIPMGTRQDMAAMQAKEWDDVECVTLDQLDLGGVTLIKADVEGMELAVLRGAQALIERRRPLLYIENDRPALSEQLIRHVWKMGYWCAWHTPRMFSLANYFNNQQNIYGDKASVNMICVPKGRTLPKGVGARHGLKLVEDAKKHPVLGM
jgi:FkbM family methyltransferase